MTKSNHKLSAGVNELGIAWREMFPSQMRYIGAPNGLPGRGGVDWGWTKNINEALPISVYWARRFKSDMRKCGCLVA